MIVNPTVMLRTNRHPEAFVHKQASSPAITMMHLCGDVRVKTVQVAKLAHQELRYLLVVLAHLLGHGFAALSDWPLDREFRAGASAHRLCPILPARGQHTLVTQ